MTPFRIGLGVLLQISIHTLRMEGDQAGTGFVLCQHNISIHTLRMEGDYKDLVGNGIKPISIHTLRMEGDVPETPE